MQTDFHFMLLGTAYPREAVLKKREHIISECVNAGEGTTAYKSRAPQLRSTSVMMSK